MQDNNSNGSGAIDEAKLTQEFSLGTVLSAVTGLMLARDMGDIYMILNWMTGDDLMTHQLPRASEACGPLLLQMYPKLQKVVNSLPPEDKREGFDWQGWLSAQETVYGSASIEIPKLSAREVYESKNPITELSEMLEGRENPPQVIIATVEEEPIATAKPEPKRTQQEILDRIAQRTPNDPLGFEIPDYLPYLDYKNAKQYLRDGVTEQDWKEVQESHQSKSLREHMIGYMEFAWDKANGCRGISAARTMQHYAAWLWLDGADELSAEMDSYEYYGKDNLIKVCQYLGLDASKWDDGIRTNNG